MTIFDIFKPKWKHQNPDIRLQAIKKLSNRRALRFVVTNDTEYRNRLEAYRRLEIVTDQEALADIAINEPDADARLGAIRELRNQEVLRTIAENDEVFALRQAAYQSLGEHDCEQAISDVARHSESVDERLGAIQRLTDTDVLCQAAEGDEVYQIRAEAFKRLGEEHSQQALADVAKNDHDVARRLEATKSLFDLDALNHISENDSDENIRSVAKQKATELEPVVKAGDIVWSSDSTGYFSDPRDGIKYRIVRIGDQVWTAQNIAHKLEKGFWAYWNDHKYVAELGLLYNWESAHLACPAGWHLPSDDEWEQLAKYVSDTSGPYDRVDRGGDFSIRHWENIGGHLKSKHSWDECGNGTDDYGFAGLPSGTYIEDEGFFSRHGQIGDWWSSTACDEYTAWNRRIRHHRPHFEKNSYNKSWGMAVRCVLDSP